MIVLRQKEFANNGQQQPITPEKLKAEKDASFNAGVERGRREAEEAANKAKEEANKRARRLEQIEEYTGLDDVKRWGKRKKDSLKEFIKSHKKGIRTGFKIGVPVVLASGLTYGGIKIYKSRKNKSDAERKSEDIRNRVRGYDNKKKK